MPLSNAEVADRLSSAAVSPGAFIEAALQICSDDRAQLIELFTLPHGTGDGRTVNARTAALGEAVVRSRRNTIRLYPFVVKRAKAALTSSPGWPSDEAMKKLVAELQAQYHSIRQPAVIARAMADAVDEVFIDLIRVEFETRGPDEAVNGRWIPTPPVDLYSRYREQFGTPISLTPDLRHTESAAFHIDRTANVRLVPDSTGITVRAVTGFADALDLMRLLPMAAAVAPLGASTPRTNPTPGPAGIFGCGPVDQAGAWAATLSGLRQAAAGGAEIAVVPELNIGTDINPDLTDHTDGAYPQLVLCGSRHAMDANGYQLNEATVHVAGEKALTHRKMHAFQSVKNPAEGEDITVGSELQLLTSKRWSIAVLICADVHLDVLIQLLKDLRVNLLLVCSLTPKPGLFKSTLKDISVRNQALVVWANDPVASKDVDTAMFILPAARKAVKSHRNKLPRLETHTWERT
jgi:hypothetical protein